MSSLANSADMGGPVLPYLRWVCNSSAVSTRSTEGWLIYNNLGWVNLFLPHMVSQAPVHQPRFDLMAEAGDVQ